jgi:hypothetical protein
MKKSALYLTFVCLLGLNLGPTARAENTSRFMPPLDTPRDRLFDEGWLFHRGDVAGAEAADFPDVGWRKVSLPHDWSMEALPPPIAEPTF